MKALLILLLATPCFADVVLEAPAGDLSLGGIPRLIGDKLKETKPAGLIDLKGRIGGGAYLPLWTFHDTAKRPYVEAINVGFRAIQGEKPSVLVMPLAVNVTGLSARLWSFQWAQDHLTRSKFPDFFLGATAFVPLDAPQLKAMKLNDPKGWLGFVGSARF
jgi:hypothetical protein